MKGIVFTELLDMIGAIFGEKMVDDILDECELASGGAYTSAGTYDYKEMIAIVQALSARSGIPFKDLVHKYGYHLFSRFHDLMPQFFEKPEDAFAFLESIDQTIHVEVKKLYPDALLPKFTTDRPESNELTMTYKSRCPFADFASGLIAGCINHFRENISIESKDDNDGEFFIRHYRMRRHDA
jgi:hypothetical protein